jgi:hypothetical protein
MQEAVVDADVPEETTASSARLKRKGTRTIKILARTSRRSETATRSRADEARVCGQR